MFAEFKVDDCGGLNIGERESHDSVSREYTYLGNVRTSD